MWSICGLCLQRWKDSHLRTQKEFSADIRRRTNCRQERSKSRLGTRWPILDRDWISKQSERQVMVYRVSDLQQVHVLVLDVSPAILIPHYDEDSSTLFLTSKGEST